MRGLTRSFASSGVLDNLRIELRLRLAFACVLLLMFAGTAISFWYFQRVHAQVTKISIAERRFAAVLRVNNSLLTLMGRLNRAADERSPEYFEAQARKLLRDFQDDTAHATSTLREIEPSTGREELVLDSLSGMAEGLPERVSVLVELARSGDWIALQGRLANQVDHTDDVAEALMREADAELLAAQNRLFEDMARAERQAVQVLVITGLLSLLTAGILGLVVTRSITGPLATLDGGARALARGDFESRIAVKGTNELAQLAAAFNRATGDLADLYGQLRRDVSERRQAERALEEANGALQRANNDLSVFAYSASHDLQEPLRNLSLYSQMLQRNYRGRLDAQADEFIGYIVDGAARMSDLVKDLLAYLDVSGARTQAVSPAPVEGAIRMALSNLRAAVHSNDANVSYDELPAVAVEPVHLQQLFQNLISNAIKYRSAEVPQIRISVEKANGFWCFSVKDNGIGISPQYSNFVFRLFKRLHGQSEYPGTGVGLAICQKIVERNGGRIWVESEPGRGSDFRFTLPRCD